jgi:Carboxypeptidase regulatory-like domain/TonB dependent receptor/TonB-dependent Receptor Plug Domain
MRRANKAVERCPANVLKTIEGHPRALLLTVVLVIPCAVFAQGSGSSLSGLITDNSQAVVPGAVVKATHLTTNVTSETVSAAGGYYRFPSLPIGEYEVTVDHAGFAQAKGRVLIETARETREDFTLAVAGTTEELTVAAGESQLSFDDASIGSTVNNTAVEFTPLYLRNWDDLLRTVPGVQMSPYTAQNGATSAGRTGDFNVHGIHSLQNNFILDGIDNNSMSENVQELSDSSARPSVDTIQEFRIITNPYSAEFGRAPGAVVSVTTKGGTNAFHGLAFEYLRNRDLDANDFFSNENGLTKPQNAQNQFGGNLGGRIIKNRLFGFFNYEGTRIRTAINRITTVPLPNERIGDFSPETSTAVGIPYPTIYDPTTGQPFPDNKIPASRIDPNMTKIMNLFPLPNVPGEFNNYTRNAGSPDNTDNYSGRIDWDPTEKDVVFLRYSYSTRDRFIPGFFGGIADGTPTSAWGRQKLLAHSGALGFTHIFTPALTNEFRFGYERNYSYAQQDPFGKGHVDEYVPGVPENPAVDGGISQTYFDTAGALIGSPDFLPKFQAPQQFQFIDNLSFLKGPHSFKFGGEIHNTRNIFMDEPGTRGSLYFDNIFTCQIVAGGCADNTGNSYADGLLGYVQAAQLTNVFDVDQRIRMYGLYAQDNWKVTRKLTLNLGLRWDFAPYALEGQNRQANFEPAGLGSMIQATSGSLASRALINPNWNNWGPRVGFAYSPDHNTVFRGGFGVFYALFERVGSEDELALNPPALVNNTPAVAPGATAPVFLLRDGFPSDFLNPADLNLQTAHIRAGNPHMPNAMTQQWSFGVQRALPGNILAEVNYVGTHSAHLQELSDLNMPVNGVLPYPNFGYIEYNNAVANGHYNGLEASLTRRFSHGLQFRLAWTWSRSIDDAPEELVGNDAYAQNGYGPQWTGPSDFDTPQRVVLSYVYELPAGRGHKLLSHGLASYILGNWRTSGVYTYSSGLPFTVWSGGALTTALDPNGASDPVNTAVPNVIGKAHIVGDVNCWFYASQNSVCDALAPNITDAFQLQQSGQFGSSGRNSLRGPHVNSFAFDLMKDFAFKEGTSLQFRWEAFNLFNTPIFATPSNDFSQSSAGQITSLAGDPRVMQFALRFSF